jgi:cytoskeletal protein RodZ
MAPLGIAPTAPNPMLPPVPQAAPKVVQAVPLGTAKPAATGPAVKPAIPKPVVKPKKSSSRRRKSVLGTALFAMFILGMFGIIASLLYFMMYGTGHLSVTSKDGQISVSTTPQGQTPATAANSSLPTRQDHVLGAAPSSGLAKSIGSLADANPMTKAATETPEDPMTDPSPLQQQPTNMNPVIRPTKPEVTPPPETKPTPEMDPAPSPAPAVLPVESGEQASPAMEMTDEMIEAANTAIAQAERLIQQANWEQMKTAANEVTEMTLSSEQRKYAEALYQLADLATFYRNGVVKGIATLQPASTFELTEGISFLVVETSPNGLTLRRGARNKSYTLEEMPFVLTEKLCAFVLSPDKPENIAARSCFQAIARKSNTEYRKDAVAWLESVNDEIEGVDTKEVAKAIKKLFPN